MGEENQTKKAQLILRKQYEEYIVKLEDCAKNGLLVMEAKQKVGLTDSQYQRIMSTLKIEDRKRHEQLTKMQQENLHQANFLKRKKCSRDIKYTRLHNLAQKIVNKEMTLEEGANVLQTHTSIFAQELLKITEEPLKEQINGILIEKGFIRENKPTKSLFSYPYKVIEELFLMALTYRTSEEDVARIIDRSPLEVHEVFSSLKFSHYWNALNELYLELLEKDEEIKNYSYKRALSYYEERNRLYKFLKVAKKDNNVALVEKLQKAIREHLKLVDDTSIIQNIKKNTLKELSEEEKDAVGYYLLRYYPTKTKATQELRLNYKAIDKCKNQLAEKDDFYALKIQRYDRKVDMANPFPTNYEEEQKRR